LIVDVLSGTVRHQMLPQSDLGFPRASY
jgi:hypothetical protein